MARNGEILNTSLLRRMADFLDIGGIRRYPTQLNTDIAQAVYDLSPASLALPPAAPVFTTNANNSGNFPAGATLDVGVNLVGSAATASFNPANTGGNIAASPTLESRIMGISLNVSYVAAGAAADAAAGVLLSALIVMRDPGGNLHFPVQDIISQVVNASPYGFTWTFPQGLFGAPSAGGVQTFKHGSKWDGFIPPGYSCWLQLSRTAGTGFFPNLTSMTTYFNVAQRVNRGDWKA